MIVSSASANSMPPSPDMSPVRQEHDTIKNASPHSPEFSTKTNDSDINYSFGSEDVRMTYNSTTLSTPVSLKSGISDVRSTPASTPFRSCERPKSHPILKQNGEQLKSTHPVFSLAHQGGHVGKASHRRRASFEGLDSTGNPVRSDPFSNENERTDGSDTDSDIGTLSPESIKMNPIDVALSNSNNGDRSHPSACLFVASLSSAHSLESLRTAVMNLFVKWNPIDVTTHRDNSDRPYAFVQLRSYEDARDALMERRGALIYDRPVRCEHARVNRALFLASSSKHLGRREAENIFRKFGQLEFIICATISYGRGILKGWCAKFEYREDAIEAYFHLKPLEDCIIFYVQNPDPRIPISAENPSVFVRNLSPVGVTTDMLEKKFAEHGTVIDVEIMSRNDGGKL
ncbi:hypothetical protein V1511DRAFT_464312 [Dipodascopsis uninucleata]